MFGASSTNIKVNQINCVLDIAHKYGSEIQDEDIIQYDEDGNPSVFPNTLNSYTRIPITFFVTNVRYEQYQNFSPDEDINMVYYYIQDYDDDDFITDFDLLLFNDWLENYNEAGILTDMHYLNINDADRDMVFMSWPDRDWQGGDV